MTVARSVALFLIFYMAFVIAGHAAEPAMVFKDENVTVRLEQGACLPPVAKLIRDEIVPQSKSGTATFEGRTIRICWAVLRPGMVTVVDEEGDSGALPMEQFKPAESI